MTRIMGDATHDNVAALAQVPGLELVAGYVTGSPDIKWTTADWAQFPLQTQVSIDQGFTGSPVSWAVVRDVEQGAWTATQAVDNQPWTPVRPTIYCNRNTLPLVAAAGWQGDLWLAIPGWTPDAGVPVVPNGMTLVAIQNNFDNPAYDLSVVFDPAWPAKGDPVTTPIPQLQGQIGICTKCAAVVYTGQVYPGNANVCPGNQGGLHVPDARAYSLLYAQ